MGMPKSAKPAVGARSKVAKGAATKSKPKFGSSEWNAMYGIGKKAKKAK
jgi:hypothetical protein